jgi:hypothetical protein
MLDDENQVPLIGGKTPYHFDIFATDDPAVREERERLRQTLRYYSALEFRNRSAAAALDRYFQLTDVEGRMGLLHQAFPIIDALIEKAKAAKAADVKFPLEPADLVRQRSQLVTQLEQAELGSRMLNIDLKRRLALPAVPMDDRLWPVGDFTIDPNPVDIEKAVHAALADRPELRGLRALYQGLTPNTLPDARDFLRASNMLLGQNRPTLLLRWLVRRNANEEPITQAEVDLRRKQIYEVIATQERNVADETRAAALAVNAQIVRAILARDRLKNWEEKLDDAVKKRDAKQPGAEFLEPQVRVEWLKAKAELANEVAAWHQARIRLKAAQGWLAWEAASTK